MAAKDEQKTKKQLIEELAALRRQVRELKSSETMHKQAGELLHLFRINSPIGLYIVQDRKFIFANQQFQRILGIKAKKLVGTYPLEHVHPEDREMVRENAIKMLRGEPTSPYKYRIISRDGQLRWIREGVVSIEYQGRRAALGHAADITDRVEAEEKLQQLYENEKNLRHELEAEVQKRIEYTRALVHELKTPITPVLFSSELLVGELHEEPWASIARNIHRGATNLNNRIDELLDLARVEIGGLQLDKRQINSSQLLNTIADYVKALIAKNKQHLVPDIPPNLPPVWADEERLQQIILNLLVNASKFTPEAGTITLAAREQDNSLLVEVQDTGPGIRKKEQEKIFEPYQRKSPDRERLGGLGLGLSLCKNLVELHGGRIWVESQGGRGSTFAFSIPLEPPAQEKENRPKEQASEVTGH
ncbi:ATP-binding protein [Chloroflexota bacterium]